MTSELRDANGMNVLQYAVCRGAGQFLKEVLSTDGVYRNIPVEKMLKFDVTYLIPSTIPGTPDDEKVI